MKLVYSGNPKLVVYMLLSVFVTLSLFFWVWTHTDKPITPRQLWSMEHE